MIECLFDGVELLAVPTFPRRSFAVEGRKSNRALAVTSMKLVAKINYTGPKQPQLAETRKSSARKADTGRPIDAHWNQKIARRPTVATVAASPF
ncbi:hypothetical protein CRG98_044527 [Punica granatum]|uniref:Uncharacterized protein n=1 Tax=Punica granatum TaxID=22663 RepID=A0A2I0HTP9_PUNGR|nr:hypothetical protein CRG98_044527 [Punica granatum]